MPLPKLKTQPRDLFLYLLAVITLYISVWRLIALLFEYINIKFPDQLDMHEFFWADSYHEIRFSMATLIVVFPVYIAVTWFLRKDIIKNPAKRELTVRKWLLNMTLFLAAITIIVDLITLLYNFLNGELTLRFLLKVLVVFVVAAFVFVYYFWDLKRETNSKSTPSKLLAITASAIFIAVIIFGFIIAGSPAKERKKKFDITRVSHLQQIQGEVVNYWQYKGKLPEKLAHLQNNLSGYIPPVDPETGGSYNYNVKGRLEFELCANFNFESDPILEKVRYPGEPGFNQNWVHGDGLSCFVRTIDPDLYGLNAPKTHPISPPSLD